MNRSLIAPESGLSHSEARAVLFRCQLDEQTTAFLPRPFLTLLRKLKVSNGLVLNPFCALHSPELRSLPYLSSFAAPDEIVWVLDPDRNALQPFWVSQELRSWLASLQPGMPADDPPSEAARLLYFSGVLISPDEVERRRREAARSLAKASDSFLEKRYVTLKDILHPLHIAALRRYIRRLIAAGMLEEGKSGYEYCHLKHNEPVARFFHYQLTSLIGEVVAEPVQPSFAFTLSYHGGAELSSHTDREQCEFTLSLCIDFVPEPREATGWPIYLQTEGGRTVVDQALGDGILFCGRELPHYRRRLADGCTATSILFHFVRRNFDGKLR